MFAWVRTAARRKRKDRPKPDYQEAKRIAAEGDEADRVDLASFEDLEPELLYYFANDEAPTVRREVAKNDGAPIQADLILARDTNDEVRAELARKVGRLVPSLTEEENEQLTDMVMEVLTILAKDQEPRVRTILADEIKHLSNVPAAVVRRLARDAEEIVAAPILEYSPLLGERELLQIIAGGVRGGALAAIARRRHIREPVSDAVARTEDPAATEALLENQTARINEKTLEHIAVVADDTPELHRPLVDRNNLSLSTIRRIATFVGAALLERLIERNPIDDAIVAELRRAMRERIDTDRSGTEAEGVPADERAMTMMMAGELDEDAVLAAVDDGDNELARHALALLADIPERQVARLLASRSGKAVTALAWKAGLGMRSGLKLQTRLAGVPGGSRVRAAPDGGPPMTEKELQWYVDFFEN